MGLNLIYSKCRNHDLILERSQPEFRDVITNFPEMTKILQNRLPWKLFCPKRQGILIQQITGNTMPSAVAGYS
jgi:hypothetical protein